MSATAKEEKRQRILDAAVFEIAKRGYHHTSVAAIAGRAGVADGTIYLYFSRKEDILLAIFERAIQRFDLEARMIAEDASADAERKLRRIIELHLTLLGEDRDMAVIFQVEFRHTTQILELLSRSRIHEYLKLIAGIVDQGKEQGVFRSDVDSLFAAKALFGVLDEMATDWVVSKKNTKLVAQARAVCDLVLGGLQLRESN